MAAGVTFASTLLFSLTFGNNNKKILWEIINYILRTDDYLLLLRERVQVPKSLIYIFCSLPPCQTPKKMKNKI